MGWVIAAVVVVVMVALVIAIEVRGTRKRASSRRRPLEPGADPQRDGVHPPYGSWLGGTGGSGGV